MIAVVVVTYNRLALLRKCVENVLLRTSSATTEVVVWSNGSTDGTEGFLNDIATQDCRIRTVNHSHNIGQNAYARAFGMTKSPHLVELDDDVIEAPREWDRMMLEAFTRLPKVGFLSADLVDDEHDEAAHLRYRVRPHVYTADVVNGIELIRGPTGGGCAMTSRAIYDQVGGFREDPKRAFWAEDATYIADIAGLGYEAAILAQLKVHHAGGPYYAVPKREKLELAEFYLRQEKRKNAVKRLLLAMPPVRRLNERRGWFQPPELWWQDYLEQLTTSYRKAIGQGADGGAA
jgi:GT2 family glycosyltransferase